VILLLGGGAARIAAQRQVELDRERFAFAEDPHATKGSASWRTRRRSARSGSRTPRSSPAPALAYWLAYEFAPTHSLARALPATALIGFAVGSLVSRRGGRSER